MIKRAVVFSIVVCMSALVVPAQDRFADVKVEATPVAGNVYMLTGAGGNIGVSVGEDGVLIIDDQFAELAERIRAAIKGLARNAGTIDFLLNTHLHGDHTGGNPIFGREATIIAHDNVRKRLAAPGSVMGRRTEPMEKAGLPVITFRDRLTVHFNGEEIRALHAPHSHTDGDTIVYFASSGVVHMGDTMFAGRFPFVDLENGGSVRGLIETIERILSKMPAGTKIIPGHGPLSTLDDLRSYRDMLEATAGIVRERMVAGQDLEAIRKAGFPDRWDDWGTGFISADRWIETIYESLSAD